MIKLSAHDILGQLSNTRRKLNAQERIETVSNMSTWYVMPHLIWKFNKKRLKNEIKRYKLFAVTVLLLSYGSNALKVHHSTDNRIEVVEHIRSG